MKARLVPVGLVVFALLWTWPALRSDVLVGRHPDALGTAWFLTAAPRLLGGLRDSATGLPAGADYGRPDSFVLLPLGLLSATLGAARLHGLVGVVGTAVSALAAESFARALGARRPWTLLAASAYAFGGLATTAWIEGYTYHLLDPWLPLLGHAALRLGSARARLRDGLLVALWFTLTLATSAWHGMAAALLLAPVLLAARLRGQLHPRPLLVAVGVLAPVVGLYATAFLGADAGGAGTSTGGALLELGHRLVVFGPAGPGIDLVQRSQSAALGATVLALTAAAPVVLVDVAGWRRFAGAGLAAASVSLLPLVPPGWVPLEHIPGAAAVAAALTRFPERVTWTTDLCFGAVAALVATRLAETRPRPVAVLLGAALVDVGVGNRLPWRQGSGPAAVPSAYAGEGPVLDLWPEAPAAEPGWDTRVTNTDCYAQSGHGRPIADLCLLSPGVDSPRVALSREVHSALFAGDAEGVRTLLARYGFATLAVHPDVYARGDRHRMAAALATLDPSPRESVDGGDHVVAYTIPSPASPVDAAAAWAAR